MTARQIKQKIEDEYEIPSDYLHLYKGDKMIEDHEQLQMHSIKSQNDEVECKYKVRTSGAGGMGAAGAGMKFSGNPIKRVRRKKRGGNAKDNED